MKQANKTNKISGCLFLLVLMFSSETARAQGSGYFRAFGEMDTKFEEPRIEGPDLKALGEFTPIERPVDADSYILGPGDILGINIATTENLLLTLRVNPTGDLLIPSVGILRVAGLTLSDAIEFIKRFVTENAYRNSLVDVTLVDVRRFRILVVGGVQRPGFVTVTTTDRLTEVISEAAGLHKYSDEENIRIVRAGGDNEYVSLKAFLLDGDLANNPTFREGDHVEVPFLESYGPGAREFVTLNESAVLVTGFVNRPGAFRYFPGYTVRDYLGMAGGVQETGSTKNVSLHRSNKEIDIGFDDFVRPGDIIYIPPNVRYVLFGKGSMVQIVSTTVALLLTYDRLTR